MAVISNLYVDQGSDFSTEITLQNDDDTPMDLTGYSAYSQFRKSYNSTSGYDFTCSITNPTTGKILITLPGDESSVIPAGRYLYDVEIVLGNFKVRVLEGIVILSPEITKTPAL